MLRTFQEDLLNIGVSRLRASGLISPEMNEFVVRLGDVEQAVGVQHLRFSNGGGWSFFVAPCCGRRVRTLRLYASRLMCGRCLQAHGVLFRATPMKPRRRAEQRIPKLRAMLESVESLRLKPHLWGTMEKRARHEAALHRAEFLVSQPYGRHRKVAMRTPEPDPEPIAQPKVKTKPPSSRPSSG
jgi:hypothetical protein